MTTNAERHFPVLSGPPYSICSECRTRWPCAAAPNRRTDRPFDYLRQVVEWAAERPCDDGPGRCLTCEARAALRWQQREPLHR